MRKEQIFKKVEEIYIIAFLIYLLLNSILPYVNIGISIIKNGISIVFMGIGGILILYNLFFKRELFKQNHGALLWCFIIICIISSATMLKYGYMNNIKTILWSSILFGVLYTYAMKNQQKDIERVLKVAIILLSLIWIVAISIGLYQYAMQISYQVKLEGGAIPKAQGFYYNRLFGIFVDPNFAAVTSVILLLMSIYMGSVANKRWKKVLWGIDGLFQFIYILLSGSRTGIVILLLGIVVQSWLKIRVYFHQGNKRNIGKIIITTCMVAILTIGIVIGTKSVLGYIPNLIKKNETITQSSVDKQNASQNQAKVDLNRTDLDGKGVSNLRFELWGDCLEILSSKPVLGTSPRNLVSYAKQNFPNTYPAKGYDYGNGYLAVITGTGVLGATIMLIFLGACGIRIISYTVKEKYNKSNLEKNINVLAITIIAVMLVAAFINQEIFLINSFNTAIFWLMLGYIMKKTNEKIVQDNGKEKVGIVTIHDADNYGSALQAFATQKIIEEIGYQAIIVDHICPKTSKEYGIKRIFAQKNLKAMLETIIRITILYPSRINFRSFRKKFFIEQAEQKVIENQQQFKKFVVGSDQVWNYKITGFDKAYFLNFVTDNNKKISYASSFGITQIEEDKKQEYQKLLNDFHKIAIREEQARILIKDLIGKEVPVVLDPTLLIKKEEWIKLIHKKNKYKNYILCYQIAYSQSLVDFAQELAKKTGKKIISIQGSMRNKFEAKYIWSAGPLEYIDLFLNADYIVTNSFHGTAFSINFNKNFFTELLPSFEKTSSRLESILDMFELRSRQIVDGKNANMLETVNYEKVNELLDQKRGESINILKTFIED